MHISDGVLPVFVAIGGYVAGFGLTAWSARQTRSEEMPKLAVMTAAFFVASLIHVPFGPTSVHLIIPGLTGALLGPSAFLSIGLGLLLQSLLFQFGGLTALGANALMMGVPALFCGWFFQKFKGSTPSRQALIGGVVGAAGTALSAMILAALLVTGGEDFFGVAKIALAAHVAVIIIEGTVSALTIGFLARVKPALLMHSLRRPRRPVHG
ncbi:cobalt transporter CbiM [Desulfosarcina sp.]|uniref:cobalt transporter CbiM n=1 Tax=Desulfosarcina sp. TaxID=2027861 RepID=UPI00397061C0